MMKKMPCVRAVTAPIAQAKPAVARTAARSPSQRPLPGQQRDGGEDIGAGAEERAMRQADHAAIARDEVQADGEDGKDGDLGQQLATEIAGRQAVGGTGGEQQRRGRGS